MTKQNYEREKAQREMREELREARDFSKEAESIHMMLYFGACVIQKREEENPHGTAETLWKLTKKQAAALAGCEN